MAPRRIAPRKRVAPALETLEERQLLSATCGLENAPAANPTDPVQPAAEADVRLTDGTLVVTGTDLDDKVQVERDGSELKVTSFGGANRTYAFDAAQVTDIVFSGFGGNDRFENFTNVPITALGGPGSDCLRGGTANDYLDGGLGIDTLIGGEGDDVLYAFGADVDPREAFLEIGTRHTGRHQIDQVESAPGNDTINGYIVHDVDFSDEMGGDQYTRFKRELFERYTDAYGFTGYLEHNENTDEFWHPVQDIQTFTGVTLIAMALERDFHNTARLLNTLIQYGFDEEGNLYRHPEDAHESGTPEYTRDPLTVVLAGVHFANKYGNDEVKALAKQWMEKAIDSLETHSFLVGKYGDNMLPDLLYSVQHVAESMGISRFKALDFFAKPDAPASFLEFARRAVRDELEKQLVKLDLPEWLKTRLIDAAGPELTDIREISRINDVFHRALNRISPPQDLFNKIASAMVKDVTGEGDEDWFEIWWMRQQYDWTKGNDSFEGHLLFWKAVLFDEFHKNVDMSSEKEKLVESVKENRWANWDLMVGNEVRAREFVKNWNPDWQYVTYMWQRGLSGQEADIAEQLAKPEEGERVQKFAALDYMVLWNLIDEIPSRPDPVADDSENGETEADVLNQIEGWANSLRSEVDGWVQSQVAAIDQWAADKADAAIGWLNQQAGQLESWAAGQFSTLSQRAQDTVVQLRKAATQQAARMGQLADEQVARIDRWLAGAVSRLERNLPSQARSLVQGAVRQLNQQADRLRNVVRQEVRRAREAVLRSVNDIAAKVEQKAQQAIDAAGRVIDQVLDNIQDQREEARELVARLALEAKAAVTQRAAEMRQEIEEALALAPSLAADALAELGENLQSEMAQGPDLASLDALFNSEMGQMKGEVLDEIQAAKREVQRLMSQAQGSVQASAREFQAAASEASSLLLTRVKSAADEVLRAMTRITDQAQAEIRQLQEALKRQAEAAARAAREARERAANAVKKVVGRW